MGSKKPPKDKRDKAVRDLEHDFIKDHDAIWARLDQDKRAIHELKQRIDVLGVHLLHLRKWAEAQGYQRLFELTAERAQSDHEARLDSLRSQVGRREVVETRDDAQGPDDASSDDPTPEACGWPSCPVLHEDPSNPIHPPPPEGLQYIPNEECNLQDLEQRYWHPNEAMVPQISVHHVDCVLPTNHLSPCARPALIDPGRSPISHGFEDPRHNQRKW